MPKLQPTFFRLLPWLVALPLTAQHAALAATPQPTVVRIPGGMTSLDDIGLYDVTYHYDDGHEGRMPVGWTGHFDETTGISCTPYGNQDGKLAFLIHPPWHGGTGTTDQEFHLALPRATHLSLQFSIAMKTDAVGPAKSDGATFRVFLDETKLLDKNKTDAAWSPYQFDLTRYAGKTIALRFETDPGPKRNSSFDFALWGARQLVVEGAAPVPVSVEHRLVSVHGTSTWGGCSPTFDRSPRGGPVETSLTASQTGLLDGWFARLRTHSPAAPGTEAPLIGLGWGSYLELVGTDSKIVRSDALAVHTTSHDQEIAPGHVERTIRYQLGARSITVHLNIWAVKGSAARVQVQSADPYISAVHFGGIGPVAFRRQVIIPYLGHVNYLPDSGLFANTIVDYTLSNASELQDTTARYGALTDGTRNPVEETAYFALSPDIHEVLPTPPNDPSPYRKALGGLAVLDAWGGQFKDQADWLRELASYHLTHLATIVHDWQHGGYDNELPNVLPANPKLGGDTGMKEWVNTATGLGEIIGLHENYVDFYPNSAVYDEKDVAHDSAEHLVPAWKNLIQSYATAPTAISKYARMFTRDVHARYGTNGGYLDVHSAVPPWFHVDFRSGTPGAGKFNTVLNAHRDLWKLFRQVHGGPVFGEGANHWYWSGLLDGVEAQFGEGVPSNGGETAPLFPDFDLLKIHPLQFNHGMGYLERWGAEPTYKNWTAAIPPMKTLDQYRMQEIVYGHAAFIASPLVHNLAFIWQECNLVLPVTEQYSAAQPRSIEYEVDGKMMDASEAIAAHAAFERVHVQYENGLSIWANGRADVWNFHTAGFSGVLPQYGWNAKGGGTTAYSELRDGVVVDYAETPASLFANARTTIPEGAHPADIEPSILHWEQTGPRRFRVTFRWNVRSAIPAGESAFLHVTGMGTDQGESIVFQPSMGIATPPGDWPIGKIIEGQPVDVTIPDTVKDGALELKAGLYSPTTGERMFLKGMDDGSRRIILGRLIVSDGGKTLRLEKESLSPEVTRQKEEERAAHTNPTRKRINFGKVETDGSILLERERAGSWLLTPFPRTEPFTVVVRPALLDTTLKTIRIEALGEDGHTLTQSLAVQAEGPASTFQVNTIPGAIRYRIISNDR